MTKSNNNSTEMNIWEKNLRKARAKEEGEVIEKESSEENGDVTSEEVQKN